MQLLYKQKSKPYEKKSGLWCIKCGGIRDYHPIPEMNLGENTVQMSFRKIKNPKF
jgi:hypothetical protein